MPSAAAMSAERHADDAMSLPLPRALSRQPADAAAIYAALYADISPPMR